MDHQFDESYPFVYIGHVCLCPVCLLCPLCFFVSLVSLVSPCVPCVSLCPLCLFVSFVSLCVPCVFLCSLCALWSLVFPYVPLCPVSLVSPVSPFPLKKNMKYSAALPLFLKWRENVDGFYWFHMTTCGFFRTLRSSKDVIFRENKNQNTKFCLTCLENNLINI